MFILDSLLINGIRFALDKVAQVVDQELNDPDHLHRQLLEAQLQLEDGTIDEETYVAIERDVMTRLREMRGDQQAGGIADAGSFENIEVEIDDER